MDVEIQGTGWSRAGGPPWQTQVRAGVPDRARAGANWNCPVKTPTPHGRNGEPPVKKIEGNREEGDLEQVRQAWQYNGIKECNEEYGDPVEFGCSYFHVSRSAYYTWLSGKLSKHRKENQQIAEKVEQIHMQHPDRGYRRIRYDTEHVSCSPLHWQWPDGGLLGYSEAREILRQTIYFQAGTCSDDSGLHLLLQHSADAAQSGCCYADGKAPDGICCIKNLPREERSWQQKSSFISLSSWRDAVQKPLSCCVLSCYCIYRVVLLFWHYHKR